VGTKAWNEIANGGNVEMRTLKRAPIIERIMIAATETTMLILCVSWLDSRIG
jgi:hypothetical protein